MRKSSKLLAVLLTLCLLFGAITAIFVSAENETATPVLNVGDLTFTKAVGAKTANTFVRPSTNPTTAEAIQTIVGTYGLDNFSYITVDLDLASTSDSFPGYYFTTTFNDSAEGATKVASKAMPNIHIVPDGDVYYIGTSATEAIKTEAAMLWLEEGVYEHFTFVYEIVKDSTGATDKVNQYVYLNGKFVSAFGSYDFEAADQFLIQTWMGAKTWNGESVDIQNFAINYYGASAGNLSTILGSTVGTGAPLYKATNTVVYNANYVSPNAATNYVTVNGTKHTFIGAAMDAIAAMTGSGNTVEVSGRALTNVSIPDGVKNFTVTCTNGGSFALSSESAAKYPASGSTDGSGSYAMVRTNDYNITEHDFNVVPGDSVTSAVATGKYTNWSAHSAYSADIDLKNFEYVTLDFDISTDSAYPNKVAFFPSISSQTTTAAPTSTGRQGAIYLFKHTDGLYYMGDGNTMNGKKDPTEIGKLSNTPSGGLDHFTFVMKVVKDANGKVIGLEHYFYLNGIYAGYSITAHGSAKFPNDYNALHGIRVHMTDNDASGSITLNNLAVNYYGENDADLAEFAQASTDALYTSNDVVYNGNYVVPGATKYVEVDSEKFYIPGAVGTIAANMKDNSVINVNGVALANLTVLDSVKKFTVTCTNGGTFALSEASAAVFETSDNKTYTRIESYVKLNGVECTVEELAAKLNAASGETERKIELVRTQVANLETTAKDFTVVCDENSSFDLSAKCKWRYTKSGNTYTRVIDGDVMASVQLFTDVMRFKIYIPLPENVSYKASYSTADGSSINKNIKDDGLHTDNGVTYQVIFWGSRMDMFSTTAYAEFEYNDGTSTTPLLARFTANFDTLEYATLVAQDTQNYPCGSEGARLVKAMTDYRVALMEEVRDVNTTANKQLNNNADRINTFDNIYKEVHGAGCTCGTYEPEDKNLPDDQKYIDVGVKQENLTLPEGVSVTFGLNTTNGVFYLIVNSTVENGDCVYVSYTSYDGERGGREAEIVNGVANLNGLNFSAADIDNAFTISICKVTYEEVKDEDGNVVTDEDGNPVTDKIRTAIETFNYSLADYTGTEYSDLVTALRNYALAAENYKKDLKEAN